MILKETELKWKQAAHAVMREIPFYRKEKIPA